MNIAIAGVSAAILLFATIGAHADIIAGPITNPSNGHDYYLLSQNTWKFSEDEAEALGGTLAIIKNASEENWVFANFSGQANHNGLWIGLHRTETGGPFIWATSTPTNYFDWAPGEPNNYGGHENCVQMQNEPGDTGRWNDFSDDNLLNGVVELPGKADKIGLSRAERSFIGAWYMGGDEERPCWIAATENALFIISDSRYAARVGLCADGSLYLSEWPAGFPGGFGPYYSAPFSRPHTGVRGKVIDGKILWSNGIWWSRKTSDPASGK